MLTLKHRNGRFWYPLLRHPVSRVLKFERFHHSLRHLTPGGTVLDYGAGDRPFESMLRTIFDHYIAADHPDANRPHARRPDIYIVGDKLDIDSQAIDCVVLTEVLEHVYEPRAALREIHRMLKPGGALIGTVPFSMKEHEQPYDFHRYTSFCLIRMFRDSGFTIQRVEYVGDMVGVATLTTTRVFLVLGKALRKVRFTWAAEFVEAVIRIPEFLYYAMRKTGLDPQRLPYFRQFPFGFVFHVEKPSDSAESPELVGSHSEDMA